MEVTSQKNQANSWLHLESQPNLGALNKSLSLYCHMSLPIFQLTPPKSHKLKTKKNMLVLFTSLFPINFAIFFNTLGNLRLVVKRPAKACFIPFRCCQTDASIKFSQLGSFFLHFWGQPL